MYSYLPKKATEEKPSKGQKAVKSDLLWRAIEDLNGSEKAIKFDLHGDKHTQPNSQDDKHGLTKIVVKLS